MFLRVLLRLLLLSLGLLSTSLRAQTLADVLGSIQERHVLLCKEYIFFDLNHPEIHPGTNHTYTPNDPIQWTGLSEDNAYPTDSEVSALSMEGRMTLLSQAVSEFQGLRHLFANLPTDQLTEVTDVADIRVFSPSDFPDHPPITAENFHAILRRLVFDVPKLRIAAGRYVAGNGIVLPFPETTDGESVDGIGDSLGYLETEYWFGMPPPKYIVPLMPTGISGCEAWLFSQDGWEPWGNILTDLKPMYEEGKFTFRGSWVPGGTSVVFQTPSLPSTLLPLPKAATMPLWHSYHCNGVAHDPASHCDVQACTRSFVSLLKHSFTKGLDQDAVKTTLLALRQLRGTPEADGSVSAHVRKGMLCSIHLGSGVKDATSSALLGIDSNSRWVQPKRFGEPTCVNQNMNGRFDYVAATLRFFGAEADFHVVYDTSRTTLARPYALPVWNAETAKKRGWSIENICPPIFVPQESNSLFSYWDSPRLRQVVGHDLVVDIPDAQATPFKQVVKIFRMTPEKLAETRTPNVAIGVADLPLIRIITFENPNAGTDGYGTGPEKLVITDDQGTSSPVTQLEISNDLTGDYTGDWAADHKNWTYRLTDFTGTSPQVAWEETWTCPTTTSGFTMALKENGALTKTTTGLPAPYQYNPAIPLAEQAASITTADPAPNAKTVTFTKTVTSLVVSTSDEPDVTTTWTNLGYGADAKSARMISSVVKGPWKTTYSVDGDTLKAVSALNNVNYATNWTDFNSLGQKVGIYSAPDGLIDDKTLGPVDSQIIEYGDGTGPSIWGMPMQITKKDGSGTLFTYEIFGDGGWSTQVDSGLIEEGVVTQGTSTYTALNGSGYLDTTDSVVIFSGSSLLTREILVSDNTPWGAPLEFWDTSTDLVTSRTYDGNLERLASSTDELGVETVFTDHDGLGRVTDFTWDSHTGTNTYSNNDVASSLLGTTSTTITDGLGRAISGVSNGPRGIQSTEVTLGASGNSTHSQDSVTGIQSDLTNRVDGTIATATGTTLPFGGNVGSSLTVDSGLLKSSSQLQGLATASQTTWTDAWGRVKKTVRPSTAPSGTDITEYFYSLPGSSIKRVITNESSGRRNIEESEPYNTEGSITRSGVDKSQNGVLDSTDRYVESITNLVEGKVVTTLSCNEDKITGEGTILREVLRTEWTPNGNITSTTSNFDEETITSAPDYTVTPKTITTESTKGWSKTTTMTKLWKPESISLTGTGIPGTTLDPTWRVDGSLAGVSYTIGGAEHTASFATDGKLSGLTDPLVAITSAGQSFVDGKEVLTINGTTTKHALNGTSSEISGTDVMGQGRETTVVDGEFEEKITPATGSDTTRKYNASGAKTLHDYNGENDITSAWLAGGLLDKIHLARNGDIAFSYSPDGAKDLIGISYPTVASGAFAEFYGTSVSITPDTAGRAKSITDPSGSRTLGYEKGRLSNTDYTTGALDEYTVERHHDTSGRLDLVTLKRNGQPIHTVGYTPNGGSTEIASVTSSNFSATLGRDDGRNITSITRGSLVQTWERPTAGRITATSSIYGSTALIPASSYSYDSKGRRTDCSIGGHSWNYRYGTPEQPSFGQLTTTGNSRFNYTFDGIGRRSGNTGSSLNQFLALSHAGDPPKLLEVSADPAARVWIDGNEVQNFNGLASFIVTLPPGQSYGWVPWQALAVLEGKGEGTIGNPNYNPLASPDARALQSGAAWVPPATEGFTYDADGNRESSTLWNYGWDGRNKLVRAQTKNCTTAPEGESIAPQGYDVTFDYDAEGRRFKKFITVYRNGHPVSYDQVTFVWDGWNLIYERHQLPNGLTTLERKYVWGPDIAGGVGGDTGAGGAGGLLLIRETRGTTTTDLYPLYDGSGHVLGLADNNGVLQAKYAYGPFGEQIVAQGPMAKSNPIRYATKYFDAETGLYYFGQRYYDPASCQWLNREPLGEDESLNLYAYCHNDPVNNVDVLGLQAMSVTSQQMADNLRSKWLLELIDSGIQHPASPDESQTRVYTDCFGLTTPFTDADYQRAASLAGGLIVSNGCPSVRAASWEEGERASQPVMTSGVQMPDVAVRALTMSGSPDPRLAAGYATFMLPTGASSFVFGGAVKAAQISRLLTTGMSLERAALVSGISSELRTGALLAGTGGANSALICGKLVQTGLAAKGGAGMIDDIALQATRNPESNKLVLGKFLQDGKSYTKVAAHYRASYFKVENWAEVTNGFSQDQIWQINERFLRQQIQQGKQIILSHDPATATGFFAREVSFLESLGYSFVRENWIWKAVR